MFRIENNEIHVTRGDKGRIPVKIPLNEAKTQFYQFKVNDKITFGVYKNKGMNKPAELLKEVIIEETADTCYIKLAAEDTKIGELISKPKNYCYEIVLNDDETILGYDENGEKLFKLYPEGSEEK